MKAFLTKTISDSVLDIDDSSRRVKVVIARMGNEDRDKEIIDRGAFTKTIKERGPAGTNEVWHLIDHNPTLTMALGKFSELYTEGDMLIGVNESIVKNTVGNDILELYKTGAINQHSIGFSIPKGKTETKDGLTHIQEVQLWEGSAVLWGANPLTETISVGKSLEKSSTNFADRIEKVILSLRKGNFSDDTYKLLALELQILQSELKEATKPEPVSTLPDVNEEKKALSNLFLTTLSKYSNGNSRPNQRH
jgi:HK97 family phage prohead protease